MTDTVLAAHRWPTNGHLIADVARLGYLNGNVADLTYGRGGFWTQWQPDRLTAHDLHRGDGVDYRHLPEPDNTYDAVVLDPDYKLSGTPASGDMDDRYGTDRNDSVDTIHSRIRDGITEAARVLRPGGRLLLKCQDQVNGGRLRLQHIDFTHHAATLGFRLADYFIFLGAHRPQPAGRRQLTAHGRPSMLLVFLLENKATQLDLLEVS